MTQKESVEEAPVLQVISASATQCPTGSPVFVGNMNDIPSDTSDDEEETEGDTETHWLENFALEAQTN